ncbi:MAG: hypothetical protein KAS32_02465 [Candidatus Peribacteraceae bacterium]|nr:hypothetical protein [Candidatus Peribacteraceae bacterium]
MGKLKGYTGDEPERFFKNVLCTYLGEVGDCGSCENCLGDTESLVTKAIALDLIGNLCEVLNEMEGCND